MLQSKNLSDKKRIYKPGDIMLGMLAINGVAKHAQAIAIVSAVHDDGPREVMILSNEYKNEAVFVVGVKSFVELIEEDYSVNKFFILKVSAGRVIKDSVPCIIENPLTDDGLYLAFWGDEIPYSHKKASWEFSIKDKSESEEIGVLTVIDVIAEDGMSELVKRIKLDGKIK